jgi:predicted GIY-YIG superfamily endonuclease
VAVEVIGGLVMTTFLYRLYNADDELLYIGISKSAIHRLHEHLTQQPWADQVAKQTIERYETRDAAVIAERNAIQSEAPTHNIVHNKGITWKQQKQLRYAEPAAAIEYGEGATLQVTRYTSEQFQPIQRITERWTQRLLHKALTAINDAVVQSGRADGFDETDAFEDVLRSMRYLPFADGCRLCMKDGNDDDGTWLRWPVGVLQGGAFAYQCHVCGNVWRTWWSRQPVPLKVTA